MKFWFAITVLLVGVASRAAGQDSGKAEQLLAYEFAGMGTRFGVKLYAVDEVKASAAVKSAQTRITALNAIFSDYDAESEVMRLIGRPSGEPVKVSRELLHVLRLSRDLWKQSSGAFDVTIGPHTRNWRMTRKTRKLPGRSDIERAKKSVGFSHLKIDGKAGTVTLLRPAMRLDFGGIVKGFAADEALKILQEHGFSRAIVMAGGDVVAGKGPPGGAGWRVGIRSINKDGNVLPGYLLLQDSAVSTSGDIEQFVPIDGKRYSHIVDPATGLGLTERTGVTVLSRRGATSDSYATAASILGARRGLSWLEEQEGVEALIISIEKGKSMEQRSKGFPRMLEEREGE